MCEAGLNPKIKFTVTSLFNYPYNERLSVNSQTLLEHAMMNQRTSSDKKSSTYPRIHLIAVAICSVTLVLALTLLPSPDATATKTVRIQAPAAPQSTIENQNVAQASSQNTSADNSTQTESTQLLALANTESGTEASLEEAKPDPRADWRVEKVKSGDTLSHIFKRVGLSSKDVYSVMSGGGEIKSLTNIHPGQSIRFNVENDQLKALEYIISRTESLLVEKDENGDRYQAIRSVKQLKPFTSYAEGVINSSLFLAAQKAGLSQNLTMELAGIFGWDIDFVLDIREGDSFRIIYQELYLDGEKVKDGQILAAEFTNQGRTFTAVRYESENQAAGYFTLEGDSMRKAFLRSPIDFARISSHFNLSRKHPVLHTIRAHKGTDYAASRGTPIKATGDGKVVFAGRKGGYGKVVILQHGQTYKTLYAHMHNYARGIRTGSRVRQGQVIGYVGSTGLATGPHLHYEFYQNGAVRNPVTVKLPHASPIAKTDKAAFLTLAKQMEGQLSTYAAAMKSENLAKLGE